MFGNCNIGKGQNFINFDQIENLTEYHFKLVWDDGAVLETDNPDGGDCALEWKQTKNPLSVVNADMKPYEAHLYPSGNVPRLFNGLSVSSVSSCTLLDGMGNHSSWWYSVGNHHDYENGEGRKGNPTYLYPHPDGNVARRTQLFVCVDGMIAGN